MKKEDDVFAKRGFSHWEGGLTSSHAVPTVTSSHWSVGRRTGKGFTLTGKGVLALFVKKEEKGEKAPRPALKGGKGWVFC